MPPKSPADFSYVVKSGDTLSSIIRKMYGQTPGNSGYRKSLDHVLSLNPQIKNPNLIYPGSVIRLGVVPGANSVGTATQSGNGKSLIIGKPQGSLPVHLSPQDTDYLWALSWLENNPNSLVIPGSIATGAASNLLSPGNTNLINKISDLYAEYKRGAITKGQYDYQRKVVLDQLKKNVGPMEKLLFGNKTTHETLRIARVAACRPPPISTGISPDCRG